MTTFHFIFSLSLVHKFRYCNFKNCEENFCLKDLQVWGNTLEEITISTFLPKILTMPTLGKGQFQQL